MCSSDLTAVATALMGGTKDQIMNAVSNAWLDGHPLRTYRHAPNTGSRKSWAAGDAAARAVQLSLMVLKGEMGYPSAISAKKWGLSDVVFKSQPIVLNRPLDSYVMDHILFKIAYPAEFHAQTAVESGIKLHHQIKDNLNNIESITVHTHEAAIRIIDKQGPLNNPADRDHCMQYMLAVALLKGSLTADDYEDSAAANPDIDRMRGLMTLVEDESYTADYFDPEKRAIPNRVEVKVKGESGSFLETCLYPIGHPRRREEGVPKLIEKFNANMDKMFSDTEIKQQLDYYLNWQTLADLSVADYMKMLKGAGHDR